MSESPPEDNEPLDPTQQHDFTKDELFRGLDELSVRLQRTLPARRLIFVVVGGILAVSRWKNRVTTRDCDFVTLDRTVPSDYYVALKTYAGEIAKEWGWDPHWIKDQVSSLLPEDDDSCTDQRLLDESVEKGVIVYDSDVITAYAMKWEWALSSKASRITERQHVRPPDLIDAAHILHEVICKLGEPFSLQVFKNICQEYFVFDNDALEEFADVLADAYAQVIGPAGWKFSQDEAEEGMEAYEDAEEGI